MPAPRLITHNGMTKSITEWAQYLGINKNTLMARLHNWGQARALTQPLRVKQPDTHPWKNISNIKR